MIKFIVKIGLAGTTVYYLKEEKIWKESTQSLKIYDKLNQNLSPYFEIVKKNIPFELPKIPEQDKISTISKNTWNAAIMSTFEFLRDLPIKIDSLGNNLEIKKHLSSIIEVPSKENK